MTLENMRKRQASAARLSVIVPMYNEEDNIRPLYRRLAAVLQPLVKEYEVIFVDDGSMDGSRRAVEELHREDGRVRLIGLTRNFGHEAATTAGLDFADGDAVVIIDADLQDPPEVIAEMVSRWEEGYDVVYGRRMERKGEPWPKRLSSRLFYRMMKWLADVEIPVDTGDFRLIDREVVRRFRLLRERNRFVRAEIAWLGGSAAEVPYQREPRLGGRTKYSPVKRMRLAIDGITSFSTTPLHIMSVLGALMLLASFVAILVVLVQKIFFSLQVPGYAFLVISLFLLNGTEVFFIGLLGEYLGRTYREVQERPLYLVSAMTGFEGEEDGKGPLPGDVRTRE
mgnify:CR=1 FL=1